MGTGQGPPTWIEPSHQGPATLFWHRPHPDRLTSGPNLLCPHPWLRYPLPRNLGSLIARGEKRWRGKQPNIPSLSFIPLAFQQPPPNDSGIFENPIS